MKFIFLLFIASFFKFLPSSDTYVLISRPKILIGCGGFLLAGQFQFTKAKDSTSIIGIILCPDGLGEDFFKEDNKYLIDFSSDSTLPVGYSFMNEYLPEFYVPKRIISDITIAK